MANTSVTLKLKRAEFERLRDYAAVGGATVQQLLHDLAAVIPVSDDLERPKRRRKLDDDEVVRIARGRMPRQLRHRLSALLEAQQAEKLTSDEQQELAVLLERSQLGELRKARALREAVARGLLKPVRG